MVEASLVWIGLGMIAIRTLRHEPVPSLVTAKAVVIDKGNLSRSSTPLSQISCPAWSKVAQ